MAKYSRSTIFAIAIAGFMVIIMVAAPLASLFWGSDDSDSNDNMPQSIETPDNRVSLGWAGKLIDHRLDSITDGLNMSPPIAFGARYINSEELEGTPLEPLMYPSDTYGTEITKGYLAWFGDSTRIEMHTLSQGKFLPKYLSSSEYQGYTMFMRPERDEGGNYMFAIVGDPCIMGHRSRVESVVDTIENENASGSYMYYAQLLEQVDLDAPVQMVMMRTPIAQQYYEELHALDDGRCERKLTCIGISENATATLNELAVNMTDDIECEVAFNQTDLNLTIARITGNFTAVIDAEIY